MNSSTIATLFWISLSIRNASTKILQSRIMVLCCCNPISFTFRRLILAGFFSCFLFRYHKCSTYKLLLRNLGKSFIPVHTHTHRLCMYSKVAKFITYAGYILIYRSDWILYWCRFWSSLNIYFYSNLNGIKRNQNLTVRHQF